jgi:hypothetical protein
MKIDRRTAIRNFTVSVVLLLAILVLLAAALPEVRAKVDGVFEPGVGLKQAALIALILMILFVSYVGDLVADILKLKTQFSTVAFVGLFVILWLAVAWIL